MAKKILFPGLKRWLVAPAPPGFWLGFWMTLGALTALVVTDLIKVAVGLVMVVMG